MAEDVKAELLAIQREHLDHAQVRVWNALTDHCFD